MLQGQPQHNVHRDSPNVQQIDGLYERTECTEALVHSPKVNVVEGAALLRPSYSARNTFRATALNRLQVLAIETEPHRSNVGDLGYGL